MTDKTRRITLHFSPERSKEIREQVRAASPQVSLKQIEDRLTGTAEKQDIGEWIADLLEIYYESAGIPMVKKPTDKDPDYDHERAEPLTADPEPEGLEGTA